MTGDLGRSASVARAFAPLGVDVQLRAPASVADDALAPLARELRAITRAAGARLFVNRRLDLARAVQADGVHVPATAVAAARLAVPGLLVSAPCHDDAELARALESSADVVLVSPIFATPGEGKAAPRGVEALARARATIAALPSARRAVLVALGGVTTKNLHVCLVHADAIAAIRLFEDEDPARVRAVLAD